MERAGRGEDFVVDIQNGYQAIGDQNPRISRGSHTTNDLDDEKIVLHSGLLYPKERSPASLFEALAELKNEGILAGTNVRFVFRGAGNEEEYIKSIEKLGIESFVSFRGQTSMRGNRRINSADALMVLQGSLCNRQIPAKFYDCLASGKPIGSGILPIRRVIQGSSVSSWELWRQDWRTSLA